MSAQKGKESKNYRIRLLSKGNTVNLDEFDKNDAENTPL